MRTHAHVYGVHPNPEWAKTHGVCNVCGGAAPLHLISYAIDHGATATDALRSRLALAAETGCDCGARPAMAHLSSCALTALRRELRADLERAVPGAEELDAKLRKQFSVEPVATGMFSALEEAAFALEQEAENYRDGDKYQPRGNTLHRIAKKARAALAKAVAP